MPLTSTNIAELKFLHPYLLAVVPLLAILLAALQRRSSVTAPAAEMFAALPKSFRQAVRPFILIPLALTTTAMFTIAAARPHRVDTVSDPVKRHNLMLSIDLSRSMATRDFLFQRGFITRIDGVKLVLSQFLSSRPDDRIGLVVFGNSSFLQSPLTSDTSLLEQLVQSFELGMAGDGTAIGDGIGLALQRIEDVPGDTKAIILLTDGVSNAGTVNPLKAAKVAADLGVKVHTIGIGSTDQSASTAAGGISNLLLGNAGAEFDEQTLKEIAQLTGGIYRNASSVEGLQDIYNEIDRLNKSEEPESARVVLEDLFAPYAAIGLMALISYLILSQTYLRRIP